MRVTTAFAMVAAMAGTAAADPASWITHDGMTLEVKGGAGVFAIGSDLDGTVTDPLPLSMQVAVGGFVTPRLAITGQLAFATGLHDVEGESSSQTFSSMQVGPAAQLWLAPFLWVGGGCGLAKVSIMDQSDSAFGVNARAGVALPTHTRNSWAVSVEGTSTFGADHDWVSASLLLGYQYL